MHLPTWLEAVRGSSLRDEAAEGGTAAEHEAVLIQLRDWFDECTGFARLAITRRDILVRLGLAEQKPRDEGDPA